MFLFLTSWREIITKAMDEAGESWEDLEECTIDDDQLDEPFDNWGGGGVGAPFTLWTYYRVYFPVTHDGRGWCMSAPRNPCHESMIRNIGDE